MASMPRLLPLAALALLTCATLSSSAQNPPAPTPIPITIAPQPAQPKPEDAIAALHAAMDALLQQRGEHRQFLYTLEMDETYSTPDGQTIGKESRKFENLFIAGKPYARLIEKDGKPLSKKEAAEEEKKYNKALESHNSYTTSQHFAHTVHGVDYDLRDVQSSYTLRYVGWQVIDGRRLWRIDAFPPPPSGAKPVHQVKVTFWLDEQTKNIVRDDSTLYKDDDQLLLGSRDSEEFIQVEGVYCITHLSSHLVLKEGHVIDSDHIYTNYKKFNSTIKILPGSEVVDP